MRNRRMVFSMFFFLGSVLAGTGWFAEIRDLPLGLDWAILAGHALQVMGAFGLLLVPDGKIEGYSGRSEESEHSL